ncbi:UNVERIFIED_CONTAM: bystin family protein, partial [Bacteroidetes bacterium 56_B9]
MEGVLLEKCRENMRDNGGKLSVHLYEALKKGLYKPAAFFKGILFPLCEVSHVPYRSRQGADMSSKHA